MLSGTLTLGYGTLPIKLLFSGAQFSMMRSRSNRFPF